MLGRLLMVRLSMIPAAGKAVVAFGSLSIFAQVVPLTGVPVVDGATRWTLEGALVIAVGCLVRAVVALFKINAADRAEAAALARAKDSQILTMAERVIEALTLSNQVMQAATVKIEANTQHVDEMRREMHLDEKRPDGHRHNRQG